MEKSQEKITALVVALTLSGSLAGATSILLRDGEMTEKKSRVERRR